MKTILTEECPEDPVEESVPIKTLRVGVIRSYADLVYAQRNPDAAQAYGLRLDAICGPEVIEKVRNLKERGKSIILDIRAPEEGGRNKSLDIPTRAMLFREHLDIATHVDIDDGSAVKLAEIRSFAKMRGVKIIISSRFLHFFPSEMRMLWPLDLFRAVEADILRLVAVVKRRSEMSRFDAFAEQAMKEFPGRIAPMAIGAKYGQSSCKRFAVKGAAFVDCYLSEDVGEEGWQASEFKKEMGE